MGVLFAHPVTKNAELRQSPSVTYFCSISHQRVHLSGRCFSFIWHSQTRPLDGTNRWFFIPSTCSCKSASQVERTPKPHLAWARSRDGSWVSKCRLFLGACRLLATCWIQSDSDEWTRRPLEYFVED